MSSSIEPADARPVPEEPAPAGAVADEHVRRVVVRRPSGELTAEERRFLDRLGQDRPPHHDSSWG